uniref:CS domain-containing protein n=1 Tax=Alexandrium catenella TaxID=2925 RepID=A0A7S1KZM6_ALECA|mmetsp:Transcript_103823/g.276276  ORF Transcript_103823/g.276276 Transcript_103823/m.276276 type:complete len:302 (+) Transcript_103823:148-1053(+)
MGFKYVLIPAATTADMQELDYDTDVLDLSQDPFREHIEKYFRGLGQSIDRKVLLQQLSERTGMDLEKKSDMPGDAMDQLLSATSLEIFPVMLPTKDTGFHSISAYCDDKGIAKDLEENTRASGLARACGYPGQTFRGDIFLGRVFDDTEDVWKRMDFTLKDCASDADWMALCRKQRENRSSGDLSSLAGQIGAKNPAHINSSMLQDAAPTGETEQYTWRQTDEEVEVTFKKEGLQKGDKKLVKVAFARQRLKVEVKGEILIDTALFSQTNTDENTWTLSDGVLQVSLAKTDSDNWMALAKE